MVAAEVSRLGVVLAWRAGVARRRSRPPASRRRARSAVPRWRRPGGTRTDTAAAVRCRRRRPRTRRRGSPWRLLRPCKTDQAVSASRCIAPRRGGYLGDGQHEPPLRVSLPDRAVNAGHVPRALVILEALPPLPAHRAHAFPLAAQVLSASRRLRSGGWYSTVMAARPSRGIFARFASTHAACFSACVLRFRAAQCSRPLRLSSSMPGGQFEHPAARQALDARALTGPRWRKSRVTTARSRFPSRRDCRSRWGVGTGQVPRALTGPGTGRIRARSSAERQIKRCYGSLRVHPGAGVLGRAAPGWTSCHPPSSRRGARHGGGPALRAARERDGGTHRGVLHWGHR